MRRTDNSVAILTGMIIAALYVILLVGFSRESYMRRDAALLGVGAGWTMTSDISKRLCRVATASCGLPDGMEDDAQACATPLQAVGRLLEGRMRRMSLQDLQDAVGGAP